MTSGRRTPAGWLQRGPRTFLRRPVAADQAEFLAAVGRSRALYRGLVRPPATPAQFRRWLARQVEVAHELHLLCRREDGAPCGVLTLSEILRGPLQCGFLGYYAFAPFAGRGYMTEGIDLVLRQAFARLKLHRVEAHIQPDNAASIALAARGGLSCEGLARRYLKVSGRWRDHLRFAIVAEDWRRSRPRPGHRQA